MDRSKWLVIGYGNTLRRDDGAGPEVARAIQQHQLPGVAVIVAHQLLPEHAEALARCQRVVFVDACVGDDPQPGVPARSLLGRSHWGNGPDALGHTGSPGWLLGLAELVYQSTPEEAWLVTMRACDLGLGEGFSEPVRLAVASAIQEVTQLVTSADEPPRE